VASNPLVSHPAFIAGKHGYLPEAGRTYLGTVRDPVTEQPLGIVLLGSADLVADVDAILAARGQ
jgi:hypothetical protein